MSTSVLDFYHTMTHQLTLFGRYISTSLKSDTQTNKKTQTFYYENCSVYRWGIPPTQSKVKICLFLLLLFSLDLVSMTRI